MLVSTGKNGLNFNWIQEGFTGGVSAEAPKPHSGAFSGRFGSESGSLPGSNSDFWSVTLQVVFPLRGPGKPPGWKSPKNGEKLQNSPPRSDPRKWGKITEELQKLYFQSNLTPFLGQFSPFSGVGPGRGIL